MTPRGLVEAMSKGAWRRARASRPGLPGALKSAALALILVHLPTAAVPADARNGFDLSDIGWSRLLFVASEAVSEVSAEVILSQVPAGAVEPPPGDSAAGFAILPPDAPVALMTGTIRIERFDKTFRTEVWFRRDDAAAFIRRRDKAGKEPSRKTFWYLADAVQRVRADPEDRGEADLPPEAWTRVSRHLYPYGAAQAGCASVTDPAVLLLIAAAGNHGTDGRGTNDRPPGLCVFNKQTLYRVALRAAGAAPLKVAYRRTGQGAPANIDGEIMASRIVLEPEAGESGPLEPDPFEFFEMTGEIEIWLDPATGVPVQVGGQVTGIGRVTFLLREVTLRD